MLNLIAVVGRLTREPEAFTSADGNDVLNFTLAFSQGLNPDGTEDTGFIDCKCFKNLAKVCGEWLSKGDKIAVTGRINYRKFVRKDGTTGVAHQILVNDVEFIDLIKNPTAEGEEEDEEEAEEVAPVQETPKAAPEKAKPVAKATRSRR